MYIRIGDIVYNKLNKQWAVISDKYVNEDIEITEKIISGCSVQIRYDMIAEPFTEVKKLQTKLTESRDAFGIMVHYEVVGEHVEFRNLVLFKDQQMIRDLYEQD